MPMLQNDRTVSLTVIAVNTAFANDVIDDQISRVALKMQMVNCTGSGQHRLSAAIVIVITSTSSGQRNYK